MKFLLKMYTHKTDSASLEHPIICYDGYCGLCDRFVRLLIRIDKSKVFRYVPLQSPVIQTALKDLKLNTEDLPDSVILIADGKFFVKSAAVFKIARLIGFPFKLIELGI
jgi:predicted DCC family thiol-disulfide oxidoreductase YuxK